jgi:1-acyl-sn-glycerol-3-phosphate acyltransferase
MNEPHPTPAGHYRFWRWLMRDVLLRYLGFPLLIWPEVEGLEHLPPSGPTILMMNHSFSVDGVVMLGVVRQRDVIPLLKIENMQHWFIGPLARRWGAYGIERGEVDRAALKTTLELLEAGALILMAPEGTRQRQLMRPKDGLAYLALKSGAAVVPVGLSGGEGWLKNTRRLRRTRMQVKFGPAFRLKAAGERVKRDQLGPITDDMMYQLAQLLPPDYRGQYSDLSQAKTEHLLFLNR